jgi:hypothetical protein
MKYFLLSFLIVTNAFSATLNCEQNLGWETQDMFVKAQISSEIKVISETDVSLENVELNYTILFDLNEPNSIWSQGNTTETTLPNNENYNPRKYHNHMKFSISVYSDTSEGYGYLDLIVPTTNLVNLDDTTPFKAYLMMTWMDDHFGGTAQLNCNITK